MTIYSLDLFLGWGNHSAHFIYFMLSLSFPDVLYLANHCFVFLVVRWENGPCYFILSMSRSQFVLVFNLKHKYLTPTITVFWPHQDLYSLNPSFSFISLILLQLFFLIQVITVFPIFIQFPHWFICYFFININVTMPLLF